MQYKRIFVIVLDSLGIGEANDSIQYGDCGVNTLGHIADAVNGLTVKNLECLGLGNLGDFKGINKVIPQGYALRLHEISNGKDTMTGHWEMMGLKIEKPFITFTETGFPDEFIQEFERLTKRKCVGNIAASGTEIIDIYGEHQIRTGDWIVYTSADSVFQIAANEEIIPLDELYEACKIARELAMDERYKVGRIIARPYIGKRRGEFIRTANRHDLALAPFDKTILDCLKEQQYDVIAIGKIADIFVDQGITKKISTISNYDGMEKTISIANDEFNGLCFVNLVDFDAKFGHRRNPKGYADAIIEFDNQLGTLINNLLKDDLLMITADHGNDPTYKGSDHTREIVPLLIYSKKINNPKILDDEQSFAVIGSTIADNFDVELPSIGRSILKELI